MQTKLTTIHGQQIRLYLSSLGVWCSSPAEAEQLPRTRQEMAERQFNYFPGVEAVRKRGRAAIARARRWQKLER